jgi:hypothetical protein
MYIVTKVNNIGYNVSELNFFIASGNSIEFETKQEALSYVRGQLENESSNK